MLKVNVGIVALSLLAVGGYGLYKKIKQDKINKEKKKDIMWDDFNEELENDYYDDIEDDSESCNYDCDDDDLCSCYCDGLSEDADCDCDTCDCANCDCDDCDCACDDCDDCACDDCDDYYDFENDLDYDDDFLDDIDYVDTDKDMNSLFSNTASKIDAVVNEFIDRVDVQRVKKETVSKLRNLVTDFDNWLADLENESK